ncbi:MAG TPA: hypothetical protein VK399_02530 [Longimicrobiaceae bacterium]|nr:hypothetical protein [Longimicrobiaceae bacterium]
MSITLLVEDGAMISESLLDDAATAAARSVLLVLRAALSNADGPGSFKVRFGQRTVPADVVAGELAAASKPIRCGARLDGGVLEVVCESAPGQERPAWDERGVSELKTGLARSAEHGASHILLVGRGESLRLLPAAVEAWHQDYIISVPYSLSGRSPLDEQRREGVTWVLEAGPGSISTTSVDDLLLPEPLRGIIASEFQAAVDEARRT